MALCERMRAGRRAGAGELQLPGADRHSRHVCGRRARRGGVGGVEASASRALRPRARSTARSWPRRRRRAGCVPRGRRRSRRRACPLVVQRGRPPACGGRRARRTWCDHLTQPRALRAERRRRSRPQGADTFAEVGFGGVLFGLVQAHRPVASGARACRTGRALRRSAAHRLPAGKPPRPLPVPNRSVHDQRNRTRRAARPSSPGPAAASAAPWPRSWPAPGYDVCVNCSSEQGLPAARELADALAADVRRAHAWPWPPTWPTRRRRHRRSSTPPARSSDASTCS